MAEIRYAESIDIAAPPSEVFAYRLDFTTLAEYNPHVKNVRQTKLSGPGVGAEYVFDLMLPGASEPMETPIRVLEADGPLRVVIETGPGYIAREICTFDPVGDGTRITFDTVLTFPGELDEGSAKAVEGQGREQARLELDLMKKNLES